MGLSAARVGGMLTPKTQSWDGFLVAGTHDQLTPFDAAAIVGVAKSQGYISDIGEELFWFVFSDALSNDQQRRLETMVYLRTIDLADNEGWGVYRNRDARPGDQVLRKLSRMAINDLKRLGNPMTETEKADYLGYSRSMWHRRWKGRYESVRGMVNGYYAEVLVGISRAQVG